MTISSDTTIPPSGATRAHTPAERERLLRRLERMETLLDRRFGVLGLRFGLDSVIGLIPVVGDTASAALSAYLINEAHKAGADNSLKLKMARNAGIDYLLGLVPFVGDIGDVFFKANTMNVRLLKEHLEGQAREKQVAQAPKR